MERVAILDHGYLQLVESWGSDESIVAAARMSTGKGFLGWGGPCKQCNGSGQAIFQGTMGLIGACLACKGKGKIEGDEKLLKFLWEKNHATPFEMAGLIVEVKAPIMVFREWHRHRVWCLAPDTEVHFDLPGAGSTGRAIYKVRIEDIWKKWQPTVRSQRPERQTNPLRPRSRIQGMNLRCLNEDSGEIIHTRIVDVLRGEDKPMVRVQVASGRVLTATRAHQVLTQAGWMSLGDAIDKRALLALEGITRGQLQRWERPRIDEKLEAWKPVVGWEELYEVSTEGRVRRRGCEPKRPTIGKNNFYDVVSLNRPGQQIVRTVHSLVLEAFRGPCPKGHEARHLDDNRGNPALTNLQWGTSKQNASDQTLHDRRQRLVRGFEEIVSVEDIGYLPTYDLSVEGPWHNFIAGGFVVHNSYNEMSARYTPLPDENYVPSLDRLMLGSDGKNRQAGTVSGAAVLTDEAALQWLDLLRSAYDLAQSAYEEGLKLGVPKELARLPVPVGRYSRMRGTVNLRNALAFLTLRSDHHPEGKAAQWEIRQFADALGDLISQLFPRTFAIYAEKANR